MTTTVEIAQVVETVEGESLLAGYPCTLVRLAGCPLSCSYCDTEWAKREGSPTEVSTLVERAAAAALHHVLVTGGEPLAQPGAPHLLEALCDRGLRVVLETSGAFSTEAVDPRVVTVLDVKCPGSGMSDRMEPGNLARLRPHDEVKLVLTGREDYDFATALVRRERLDERVTVHLSPVLGSLEPGELAGWMMADRLKVRLAVQLHKLAWPGLW